MMMDGTRRLQWAEGYCVTIPARSFAIVAWSIIKRLKVGVLLSATATRPSRGVISPTTWFTRPRFRVSFGFPKEVEFLYLADRPSLRIALLNRDFPYVRSQAVSIPKRTARFKRSGLLRRDSCLSDCFIMTILRLSPPGRRFRPVAAQHQPMALRITNVSCGRGRHRRRTNGGGTPNR